MTTLDMGNLASAAARRLTIIFSSSKKLEGAELLLDMGMPGGICSLTAADLSAPRPNLHAKTEYDVLTLPMSIKAVSVVSVTDRLTVCQDYFL